MSKASTLLLYYCTLIALFLSVSGFLTARTTESLIFQVMFLPITLYFLIGVFRNLKSKTLDVILSGRSTAIAVFIIIFTILLALAAKNILGQPGPNTEQVKSSQTTEKPESSEKDNTLIIPREETQ